MKRRLYNAAAVTSLVLFVVVTGLWVESGSHLVVISMGKLGNTDTAIVAQRNGWIGVGWVAANRRPPAGFHRDNIEKHTMFPPADLSDTVWRGLGYVWDRSEKLVVVPHWLLTILTLVLPVVWLIRRRHKPDPDAVPCAKCGYDLRGSSSGACPECGEG